MAANINVTYEQMRTAANDLKKGEDEIVENLNRLKAMIQDLVNNGYVTEKSSVKFDDNYQEFTRGASETINGLTQMADFLKTAADLLEQADTDLAQAQG